MSQQPPSTTIPNRILPMPSVLIPGFLKAWWRKPSNAKLFWLTWIAVAVSMFLIFVRPVMALATPSNDGHSWAMVLAGQAGPAVASIAPASPTSTSTASPVPQSDVRSAPPTVAKIAASSPQPAPEAAAESKASNAPVTSAPRKSEAELFGDQLDALSSLYETIITVLAVGLGVLAAVAFAAIHFASMREAQTMASEVLGSDDHAKKLEAMVQAEVQKYLDNRLTPVNERINALQDRIEQVNESIQDLDLPPDVPPAAPQPPATTPEPTPALSPPHADSGDSAAEASAAPPVTTPTPESPQPTPTPTPASTSPEELHPDSGSKQ